MTITFPRDFPAPQRFKGGFLTPKYSQITSITGAGTPNAVDVAPELFVGQWHTTELLETELRGWEAWIASLRGGKRMFKGWHPLARFPQAYKSGFGGLTVSAAPFTGSGVLSAIGTLRDTITVGSLPAPFTLTAGDLLSFAVGSRQVMHRVLETVTSGTGSLTVSVEPTVRPSAVTGGAVLLATPYCDMVLSREPQVIVDAARRTGNVTIDGIQVLV